MKTKCLICGGIYDFDEITFHLETFHNKEVEEKGLWECFEFLGASREQENLEAKEWSDFPRGTVITQEPIKYQLPYYGYIKRRKGKKGEVYYYCTLCDKEFEDADNMLTHCLEMHGEHPDTYGILKERTKELVLKQIREKHGSTERINPEQLEKYATEVLKERNILEELTTVSKTTLNGYSADLFERIFEFLTRENDVCPLCSVSIDYMALANQEIYVANQVVKSLKAGMLSLKEEDEKSFNKVVERYYEGKILGKPRDFYLKAVLHLHTAHPRILKNLVKNKIIEGALPEYIAYERYKSTKTNLSNKQDKPRIEKAVKEKALKDWLKRRLY